MASHSSNKRPDENGSQKIVLILQSNDCGSNEDSIASKTVQEVFSAHANCELLYERIEPTSDDTWDSVVMVRVFGERAKRNVDLIFSIGPEATRFLVQHKRELWPSIPAVFSTVTADQLRCELPPEVTGVKGSSQFASCAELALLVDPDTSHIFCIGGSRPAGCSASRGVKQGFRFCPELFDFAYLNHLQLVKLLDRVAHLPSHSSVLFTGDPDDVTGHSYAPTKLCELIASSSNVPVYAMSDTYLGCGVVGVSAMNVEADARRAANLGLALLRGGHIGDLPVEKGIPDRLIVDPREIAKRGIPESSLPRNIICKHREARAVKWLGAFIVAGTFCLLARAGINRFMESSTKGRYRSKVLIHRLARRFIEETENERMRIARKLHDDIGQRLSLVAIRLRVFERDTINGNGENRDEVKESLRELDALISDVHHVSHSLYSSIFEHLGIAAALKELCFNLSELHSIQVDFEFNEVSEDLSQSASLCLYRVAQEALDNVVRHSGASLARVRLFGNGNALRMEIRDFGMGFDLDAAPIGLGFATMEERLSEIGGRLTAHSERGMGTLIAAEIPLSRCVTINQTGVVVRTV